MEGMCADCINSKCLKGHQRGIMDCDPDEYYCECDNEYYEGERQYDEDGEELPCEDFRSRDWYEEY